MSVLKRPVEKYILPSKIPYKPFFLEAVGGVGGISYNLKFSTYLLLTPRVPKAVKFAGVSF